MYLSQGSITLCFLYPKLFDLSLVVNLELNACLKEHKNKSISYHEMEINEHFPSSNSRKSEIIYLQDSYY